MLKAIEVNDNHPQNLKRQSPQQSGDKPKKLRGKSFQVNENSLHEGDSIETNTPKDK